MKPYNHAVITQHAICILNESYPDHSISTEQAYYLIKGNKNEDNFFTFNLQRARNWHFYNLERTTKKSFFLHRNAWKRFRSLTNELTKAKNEKNILLTLGAILHHMQDATNPSHTVPVYHGAYDTFDILNVSDFLPDSVTVSVTNLNGNTSFESILKETVQQTNERITRPFPIVKIEEGREVQETISWERFWRKPPNGKQWGKRGDLGAANKNCKKEFDNFMKNSITLNGTDYHIPSSEYKQLAKDQMQLAVNTSAQLIYYIFKTKIK